MAAGDHSTLRVSEIECVAGRGIRGDRYFDHAPDFKGQITFFAQENLVAMWEELKIARSARDSAATRRNVITEGLDLPALIGAEFELQGIRFLGTEECRPCYWMNGAIHPGAEAWMRGRGGLRAKILSDGVLKENRTLLGALLAGGKSTRMGLDKAAMEINGEPLWQRQFRLLDAVCQSAVICAPETAGWLTESLRWVVDSPCAQGPMGGLIAALERATEMGCSHVLVLAVDMPEADRALLDLLIESSEQGRGVIFRGAHGFEPLCALYPIEALPVLRLCSSAGQWKLQQAVAGMVDEGLMLEWPVSQAESAKLRNLNTPEEVLAWKEEK